MLSIRWRGDEKLLRNTFDVEDDLYGGARKALDNMQFKAVDTMLNSWTSPPRSKGGQPPAKEDGSLDAAVKSNRRQGRQRHSLLASPRNRLETDLIVNTRENDKSGRPRDYSAALEDGFIHNWSGKFIAPRPYMKPALKKLDAIAEFELKRNIKFKTRY